MENDVMNVKEVYLCVHEDDEVTPRCFDRIEQAKDFCRRNEKWAYFPVNYYY